MNDAFWKIHNDLPRQAPGSDATTMHLLDIVGKPTGKVLDIGCGPGRASLLLAQSGLEVVAIDTHKPFLDELDAKARELGLENRITTRAMSMDAIEYPDEYFDLLWAEGSAYILGWEKALTEWKRLLKYDGKLVATECCWLVDSPSAEARDFWAENYPTMLSKQDAAEVAERAGFRVVATYTFLSADWFDEYYNPIKARHKMYLKSADDDMKQAIKLGQAEIELYEKHGDEYGYVGFILERT